MLYNVQNQNCRDIILSNIKFEICREQDVFFMTVIVEFLKFITHYYVDSEVIMKQVSTAPLLIIFIYQFVPMANSFCNIPGAYRYTGEL